MPTYCRYCHAEGHVVPDCPKKRSSRVCWNCRTSGHIAAGCTKSKNKPFKKARKTPTASQDRADQGEAQSSQSSNGTATSNTSSQPLTLNTMKRTRSIRNESGAWTTETSLPARLFSDYKLYWLEKSRTSVQLDTRVECSSFAGDVLCQKTAAITTSINNDYANIDSNNNKGMAASSSSSPAIQNKEHSIKPYTHNFLNNNPT
ncbi:hypothetical protein G6F58_010229 [Rhizopus delemar]|nr:hypothetical protein G6F58_010229 [Rhizopus delemar]